MAKPTTNGGKTAAPRVNKPRSFYMAYKGTLEGDPMFVFDKDELVEQMLKDRELQVKRITVPAGRRRKTDPASAPPTA